MAKGIQDFGEKIGGAKKDLWKDRGLNASDIQDLNITELLANVNKKNVWIEPKWKTLEKKGYTPEALYIIKYIRDRAGNKMIIDTSTINRYIRKQGEEYALDYVLDESIKYIKEITILRDFVMQIKDVSLVDDIYNQAKEVAHEEWETNRIGVPIAPLRDVSLITRRGVRLLDLLSFESKVQGFPQSFRGDLKELAVFPVTSRPKVTDDYKERWYVLLRKSTIHICDTKEEAESYCLDGGLTAYLDGKKKTKKASELVKVVRPQLERIERYAPNLRKNENTTGDDILNEYSFRGGEFGNWNSEDDRQACLNYIYDGLQDLAYCLDVSPTFLGLNNGLK